MGVLFGEENTWAGYADRKEPRRDARAQAAAHVGACWGVFGHT